MIAAHQDPSDMGNDQSQKAYRSSYRSGNTGQKHCRQRDQDPHGIYIDSQAPGSLVFQRQKITLSREDQRQDQADDHIRHQSLYILPGLHSNVSIDNGSHSRHIPAAHRIHS